MNVFKHELKEKFSSILIWSISISAFILMYMAFYPSIGADSKVLDVLIDSFPEEFLHIFGIGGGISISSLIGYFTITFVFVQLAMAIQSSHYGVSILSKEERELTADFLMTKPITRAKIYWSKFFASTLGLLITASIIAITSIISIKLFNGGESYDLKNIFIFLSTIPLFQLFFFSLGILVSLLFKKIRSVLSVSMGIAIFFYMINVVRGIIDSDLLELLTPYYYFDPGIILKSGEYDILPISICILVIIISTALSFNLYKKRDIHSI